MAHKRIKLKRKKKGLKIKFIFYLLCIYIGFSITFYYSLRSKKAITNEEFINLLVTTGNANILSKYKTTNIVNRTMNFIFNIDFTKPTSFLDTSILKYGKAIGNLETISLEYNDDYSNMEELQKISEYIEDPNPTTMNEPIIYLYNSHQLENYSTKDLEIYGLTPNVLMASYLLRENLNKLNLNTIVEEANMSDILAQNNWNYAYSYQASRQLLEDKMNQYSSLKYFIDIHRDSVLKEYSTININDKSYAKVLFVIGQDYSSWQDNNNFANELNNLINKYYPNLSRGVMLKQGVNVNGIYNQDLSKNCLLIEVGAVENTIEEVYNTMEALADILMKYIRGE